MVIIQKCGYNSNHYTPIEMNRKDNGDNHLLLLVKTPAFFEYDGAIHETPKNIAFLYDKKSHIHYGNIIPHYNDDWIHFHFTGEDSGFMELLSIPFDQPLSLPDISLLSDYIKLIVREYRSQSAYKDEILTTLMKTLLYALASQLKLSPEAAENHRYYNILSKLRTEIYNSPNKTWSIPLMSEYTSLSSSYLQHLYKELFGISCLNDVVCSRIEAAKFYLNTTDMPIRAVAGLCGYDAETHFMRQFKKLTSMTPSEYRAAGKRA